MGTAMGTATATAMDTAAMTRRRAEPRCLAFAFAAWAALSHAQEGGASGAGAMTVVPRLALMQTWTDNLLLDDRNKDAALITTLSPGISISANSGTLRGTLDYALNGIAYVKTEQPSRLQNSLAASAQAELISRRLYVDMRASIGQQSGSAFGQQSVPTLGSQGSVSNLANANQRETGTLAVSPSLRGMLGSLASYQLRGDVTRTEVRGSSLGDSRGEGFSLRVDEWNAGLLGWWLSANTQQTRSALAASSRSSAMALGLTYRPDPDWTVSGNVGSERSNYLGGTRNSTTAGANLQWTPTPRSRAGATWQRHDYGNSHTLSLEHRMARSVWRIADTQSTVLGNTGASGGVRSNYDQFFLQFAAIEDDPVKRDARVREALQALGLSPDAPAAGGFLSSGPSRLRSQLLSFTLQGLRSTLSAQMNRSITRRLGSNLNQGDLANSSRIEQRSVSLSASHRLTPQSGLSMTASRQETSGDLGSQQTQLSSIMVNWNTRLGSRLSVQVGARHSRFESVTPYTENGAYASLSQRF
ncbi:TIGR03016 family PEP-CTERM system-associated outer membrane protein [Roseateles sp. LYH14W]|uniref:TIGR03016 family PEP-CTERM system-associated outer membrane protein n=1 Tax=Pelomonas parva TaxID=3299032 RepID=A0ABW7EVX7_9BURK